MYQEHRPAHPRLPALDVGLRGARDERERRVAGVEVGEVGRPGRRGTTAAADRARATRPRSLVEEAVDDQRRRPWNRSAGSPARPAPRSGSPSPRPCAACGGAGRPARRAARVTPLTPVADVHRRRAGLPPAGDTIGGKVQRGPPGSRRRHRRDGTRRAPELIAPACHDARMDAAELKAGACGSRGRSRSSRQPGGLRSRSPGRCSRSAPTTRPSRSA